MAQIEFLEHFTTEGERWDQLAFRYYGHPGAFDRIIAANPEVLLHRLLPGGLRLRIPVVADAPALVSDLPPWKQ